MNSDKKYYASRIAKPWVNAHSLCLRYDMDMVTFESRSEYDYLTANINDDFYYAGISDMVTEGSFKKYYEFEDTSTSFVSWSPGEPNNQNDEDCVHMSKNGCNDVGCEIFANIICERRVPKKIATDIRLSCAFEPSSDKFDYNMNSGTFRVILFINENTNFLLQK